MKKYALHHTFHYLAALLCLLVPGARSFSQLADAAKLDRYFDALAQHDKFMGSVAVSQNGKLIYTRSLGFADKELGLRADIHSKYRVGSISKTFTAVLVFQAVEKKKLSLDQTIDRFFPDVKNADKISLAHLLYHRSGIHNFTDDQEYLQYHTRPKTAAEMTALISGLPSDFEPGSKASYSNSNFVLLTFILEKTFKKPYAELIQTRILKPLDLKDTYVGGKINPQANECRSYRYLNGWQTEAETDPSIPVGAGAIVSTPSDLVRFSDALFGGKLIHPSSLDQMRSLRDNYGMALFPIPFYDKQGYGHTGGIDGFVSVFSWFADGSISYAATCNGAAINPNDISIAVLSAVYGKEYEIPTFEVRTLGPEELDLYVGFYTSDQIPLKITVSRNGSTLSAQASGQAAFPLEANGKHHFAFSPAGIVLTFDPAEKTMLLKQGGGSYRFKKE